MQKLKEQCVALQAQVHVWLHNEEPTLINGASNNRSTGKRVRGTLLFVRNGDC